MIQDSFDPRGAKVFRAHAAPQGWRDDLINALKLLTNRERDGDSPVESIVTGFTENCRKGIMDGMKKLPEVDNREAVNGADLCQGTKSVKVSTVHRWSSRGGN